MANIVLCPMSMGSEGAKSISSFFGTRKVYRDRRYVAKPTDVQINWGNTRHIPVFRDGYLNSNIAVGNSSNKLTTHRLLDEAGVRSLQTAFNQEDAEALFTDEGDKVFCRTLTRASEGRGIVIAETVDELVQSRLYTKYERHTNEYRVHVLNGEVIHIVEKRKMSESTLEDRGITFDAMIKNHDNGWIFSEKLAKVRHLDGVWKTDILTQSVAAVAALGLDFGAVDVIYDNPRRLAFVLEVNSAPGMEEGTTTHLKYCRAFSGLIDQEFDIDDYMIEYEERFVDLSKTINFINNFTDV